MLMMTGTVIQNLLDSPGDEDRRSREADLERELRGGGMVGNLHRVGEARRWELEREVPVILLELFFCNSP